MIGIDDAAVVRPQAPQPLATALPEAMGDFEPEFVVEWQVADHALVEPGAGSPEKQIPFR